MKKIIKNIIILIIFIVIFAGGLFFLNEYIIGSEQIAEIFSPIYDDEVISIQKNPTEETIENPESTIQASTQNIDNINKFYYSQLDDYAKIIYNKIYENKENIKSGNYVVDFGKTFNELLNTEDGEQKINISYQSALDAYLLDNPDVFYIDVTKMYLLMNSRTVGKKTTYTVKIGAENGSNYFGEGFYSEQQVNNCIEEVETISNQILTSTSTNVYEKLKQSHDWLVDNLNYDQTLSGSNIRNIYGAFEEKSSVCEGYAKAYKYLLDKIGIENIIVVGYGTNSDGQTEEHAWNYLKLNSNWYAVDVTWDDPIIRGGGKLSNKNKYRYFLNGSFSFNDSHQATGRTSQEGITFAYPELSVSDFN